MSWNFCPNCGHRTYQHGDAAGCEHVDVTPDNNTIGTLRMARAKYLLEVGSLGDPEAAQHLAATVGRLFDRISTVCDCDWTHSTLETIGG